MSLQVDGAYVRSTVLAPLIGAGARYAAVIDDTSLAAFVEEASAAVQQRLSTRFAPTEFTGWDGAGPRPAGTPATVGPPATEAVEIEGPYLWPSLSPSSGFLEFRVRIRPLLELKGGTLRLPGAPAPGVDLHPEWFRIDPYFGTLTLMPNFGGASLVMPNLPFGLFNWMRQRIPDGVIFNYRAGMTEDDWRLYPQIRRLVALRAAVITLPALAQRINPTQVTSKSADGLSISRASGYVFKDLEERLSKEADEIQTQVLDAWEGTSAISIL
jgi:hypothetical protein